MKNRKRENKDFFSDEEEENWKDKIEEKAEEVAEDIEKKFHLTETEKNLEAFHSESGKEESFSSFSSELGAGFESEESFNEESEEDWKEEIDLPTFIVLSVEIVLLTYFILAVLGYVPFF